MLSPLRSLLTRLIPQGHYGHLDFFLYPALRNAFGGPFNGQRFRQRMFFEIIEVLPVAALVETGTALGSTTELFTATGLPVYSSELNRYFYLYSKLRFLSFAANPTLFEGDSRAHLHALAAIPKQTEQTTFFYLDAHWNDDLPLKEEVEIIFSHWKHAVVLIDDFKVPGTNYGYDDYGPGKALELDYLAEVIHAKQLSIFFPATEAAQETGQQRGCVLLCRENEAVLLSAASTTLVQHHLEATRLVSV